MLEKIFQLKNVSKIYGQKDNKFIALDNISLEIFQGECIAIVGASGSGKSTLMHILAGLDVQTTGEILYKNINLKSLNLNDIRNKYFGFVFQQFFLNARDTVSTNIELPLKIGGISPSQRKEIVMKIAEKVGLSDKLNNKSSDLSGGQKQRVCIARALVNTPEVIFADEPTGNLDSKTGLQIQELLFKLNKENKITLIIVTHDKELAKKCDRIINISDGKII